MTAINNRYDFVLLFDVTDGNPNGDPDAGNMPRMDPQNGHGLVTDVCLKRKIRNYITVLKEYQRPYDIYIKEKAVLGRSHVVAFQELGFNLGEEVKVVISDTLKEKLADIDLPDGIEIDTDENDQEYLILAPDIDKKETKAWLKDTDMDREVRKFIDDALKKSKGRKPTPNESDSGQKWLCKNFYDIRTFGAVLSLKSAPNCGQVRGPVQLTFARSINPIVVSEHSITRMAVATEAEAEKQGGDNRTMGRKFTVPYGLYRAHGFISAHLAAQTGFSDEDLVLLWEALGAMFEHDHSAARGQMTTRGLYVFKHDSALGNAPAHRLFERITVDLRESGGTPRGFADYAITVNDTGLPEGVTLLRLAE